MTRRRTTGPSFSATRERGVVLFVALLATIALAFAGVALVRAIATDVAIGGNLAMREHAVHATGIAVEHGVAALFEAFPIADTTADDPTRNYFASRQAGEDGRGVPHALQTVANYPSDMPTIDTGDGFTLRHVIERLCLLPGVASLDNCTLSPPSVAAASDVPTTPEPPRTPYYRVTVRADGPAGAAAFVQVMLGEAPSRHRLSWRVLDE